MNYLSTYTILTIYELAKMQLVLFMARIDSKTNTTGLDQSLPFLPRAAARYHLSCQSVLRSIHLRGSLPAAMKWTPPAGLPVAGNTGLVLDIRLISLLLILFLSLSLI